MLVYSFSLFSSKREEEEEEERGQIDQEREGRSDSTC